MAGWKELVAESWQMFGLHNLLNMNNYLGNPQDKFLTPGYWVSIAAYARKTGKQLRDFPHLTGNTYAKAIGIEQALGQEDTYANQRVRQGVNYSPLVVLNDTERTNDATRDINSCIRHLFSGSPQLQEFVSELGDVVGDLHDNVWSHGQSTGISMAQKWAKPHSNQRESYIEFALADCGVGFLAELKRSGIAQKSCVSTHQDAITWCVQEGNSSKKMAADDPWRQTLPPDVMNNPIVGIGRPKMKENNHLGLGLFKLTSLVRRFRGQMWLSSGDAILSIDAGRNSTEVSERLNGYWQGVALACRFCTGEVEFALQAEKNSHSSGMTDLLTQLWLNQGDES